MRRISKQFAAVTKRYSSELLSLLIPGFFIISIEITLHTIIIYIILRCRAREEMENGPHGFYRWVSQHATSSAYGMFTEQQKTVFCEMMGMGYVKGVAEKLGPPYRWYLYKGS